MRRIGEENVERKIRSSSAVTGAVRKRQHRTDRWGFYTARGKTSDTRRLAHRVTPDGETDRRTRIRPVRRWQHGSAALGSDDVVSDRVLDQLGIAPGMQYFHDPVFV